MEDEVDTGHHIAQALDVAHIANVELDLLVMVGVLRLQLVAHIVLLFLIAGENADLPDIAGQKMFEDGMPKAAGATGNQQGFVLKNRICHVGLPVAMPGLRHTSPL